VRKLSEGLKEKNEELEQLVDELRQRQEQIIMRRKLVELGELTAGVAHEIRNPLNFMKNFSEASRELLEELEQMLGRSADRLDGSNREEIEELTRNLGVNLTRILEHGDRVERIVRDMVQIGRGGGELQWVTMNDLLAKQASLAYQSVRAQNREFQVDIRHEFDPDVGRVRVVAEDMSRVFINVMQNACYWTAEKMEAGNGGEGAYVPTVWLKTRRVGDEIEIRIRDNGNGIPGDAIDKVFNPFFTTKPTDKGTGLGLSLSHDIVRQHGGSISPLSEPGEFTEMIIRIPARADAVAVA
ncbi:MAG: HAMP domain-containing histidine kinase, partial [Gemmatimonadetes bacterium]|nr:HAMP domain-containing histidine kinase [Gemmatimonadota bacterium]